MRITINMWHPVSEARQYEAAGSRTSFNEKWNQPASHSLNTEESVPEKIHWSETATGMPPGTGTGSSE
jgi:hypothetical protein